MFKFLPLQYVKITSHGLHLEGRVIRCIYEGGRSPLNIYSVNFATNGELRTNEFFEDELKEISDE